jgi:SAM-dependent methyltransferase
MQANLANNLGGLLELVDKSFGIKRILADTGRDVVKEYYAQSGPAFDAAYPDTGCMHMALILEGDFTVEGFRRQPRAIVQEMRALGGNSVLELGSGRGFNTLHLAQRLPGAHVHGIDLFEHHVTKARAMGRAAGVSNLTYEQADFEQLPERYRDLDVVFAVESLSYAQNLDRVAQSVAAALRPGGRFVMYDAQAIADIDTLEGDLSVATRLYANSTGVTRNIIKAGEWEAALARAGLQVDATRDLSKALQPGLRRIQTLGITALGDWKKRLALKALPTYLARNGVAALLGPLLYRLPQRNLGAGLGYRRISATKPAA